MSPLNVGSAECDFWHADADAKRGFQKRSADVILQTTCLHSAALSGWELPGAWEGGAAAEQAEQTRCSEERRKKLKLKLWKKCEGANISDFSTFEIQRPKRGRRPCDSWGIFKTHYKADKKTGSESRADGIKVAAINIVPL